MTFNLVTLVLLGALSILTSLKFNKNGLPWKIIAIYVIGSFISQGVATIYWKLNLNNLTILHIYSLFEFIAFSAFFWSLTSLVNKKKWIVIVSGVISCLLIANSIWNEPLRDFNSLGIFISNGTIIAYSIGYLFEVLRTDLNTKKYVLVNAGILIFICESLVVFLFGNFLKEVALIDQAVLWYTHISSYIIFLLLTLWNHVKLNR